jgi:branched-chain amino acid transport system substrate-binding protein
VKSKNLFILFISIATILAIAGMSILTGCSGSPTTAPTTTAAPTTTGDVSPAAEKTEIVLGAVNSLTGINVLTAAEQKWGQEQAVADINAKGGVNVGGKMMKLRLVFEDDQSTAEGGAAAMEKLIKVDKVDLTLSSNITPINEAAATVAEKYNMYFAINTSWTDFIRSHNFQWVTDVFASTTSSSTGPFDTWSTMPEEERPKRIAVLTEDNPDGQGFGEGFKVNAEKYGYEIVSYDAYIPGSKDYSSNILKMKSANADALLWLGSPPDGITLIQQIKAQNLNLKYIHGYKGFWDVQFPEALGKDANYIIHDGFWVETLPNPGAAELGQKFRDAHDGKDSVSVGLPYASVQVVVQAIERAGSYEAAKVRDEVFNGSFTGTVMGDLIFDADGICEVPLLALQWMDGERIPVWPDVGNTLQWMPPWNER